MALALFFLLALGPGALLSGDAGPAAAAVSPGSPSAEAAAAKARKHPSYQVFAAQVKLPEIRGGGQGEIIVLHEETIVVRPGFELSPAERVLLQRALDVPQDVVVKLLASLPAQGDGPELAASFRTSVIDYLYLLERWTMYRPRPEDRAGKKEGLRALQSGEILESWLLYIALPKPQAPSAPAGSLH